MTSITNYIIDCGDSSTEITSRSSTSNRDGRDGRDGRNGKNGRNGSTGAQGAQGAQGAEGPSGPSASLFSFVQTSGIGGIYFPPNSDILNIIHKNSLPISYIGIVWSCNQADRIISIDIKDLMNTSYLSLTIGPSSAAFSKHVYEIVPVPPIMTPITHLLRFIAIHDVTIYSIMLEYVSKGYK